MSPARPTGVYRGTVTRVGALGVWVHVSHLNDTSGHAYGPLQHLGAAPVAGDRVLVGPVDGRPDDLIVLGVIA